MLWWLFIWKFLPRWSTENHTEIATILAHDRVFRIKGLVTTEMSLWELNNLYFVPFRTVYFSNNVWKVISILMEKIDMDYKQQTWKI